MLLNPIDLNLIQYHINDCIECYVIKVLNFICNRWKKKYLRNFVKACTVYAVFKPVVAMLETPLKLCQCENNKHSSADQDDLDEDNKKENSRSHSDMIEEEVHIFIPFVCFSFLYIKCIFSKTA